VGWVGRVGRGPQVVPGALQSRCVGAINFRMCHYITLPEGKLASGTPPKGSPEDGPDMPDGALINT
jgi:hypothetical protein